MEHPEQVPQTDRATLAGLGESRLLEEVFAAYGGLPGGGVLVGPGDDTAYLRVPSGAVLATTDTVVRGRDWRDEWSTGEDVGVKVVTQNLADLAAMGGRGTGLLVTLVAPQDLPVDWVRDLLAGTAWAATRAGVPVVGGDLSSAGAQEVLVSVTALGELGEGVARPVLRSGARAGDVLAVSGPLGRSGAGLLLLRRGVARGRDGQEAGLLDHHRRPTTDLEQGPVAARAGARSMIDVSDGLVRDADRVARASGVRVRLDPGPLDRLAGLLQPALTPDDARAQVVAGGEEHELLATFPPRTGPPEGWTTLGEVVPSEEDGDPATGVWLEGRRLDPRTGGWDHFGG
ncbi:thiamine-phosphate kinase [uncultured Ornithinimicrobium sp.]|uniref:thiamine-phosphate kinase n=1 Tax=uncultured Ornithinimicrobium sp. TaxID=259307 RepID=UPI002593DA33|nr:thiamine-phosphate kinase [uncultured Ornithinimicrobium sp.]